MEAGERFTVPVRFEPTRAGMAEGELYLSPSSWNTPTILPLRGQGIMP